MIPHYDVHELAQIFPKLSPSEYEELKADIKENGVFLPIVLHDNKIIDGKFRYEIAQELGLEEIPFKQYEGDDVDQFIVGVNLRRRELTPGQKACIGQKFREIEEAKAKQRQVEAGRKTGLANAKDVELVPQASDSPPSWSRYGIPASSIDPVFMDVEKGSQALKRADPVRKIVADLVGVNEKYIQTAKFLSQVTPELFEKVKAGTMDIAPAKLLADFKVERPDLYEDALAHFLKNPKHKARDCINLVRNEALAETNKFISIPSGKKWRILYLDPPWSYGAPRPGVGSPADKYQVMPTAEICKLKLKDDLDNEFDVKDIMARDSVMFMWTTSPHLQESFQVINAKSFGFNYKTSFIWHKISHNIGFYSSVRHEFLLVATRGSCTPDKLTFNLVDGVEEYVKGRLFPSVYPSPHLVAENYDYLPEKYAEDSVYEENRGEHSVKPQYYYDLIERLYPRGEKLELFCRKPHPGWDYWGNQAVIDETGKMTVLDEDGKPAVIKHAPATTTVNPVAKKSVTVPKPTQKAKHENLKTVDDEVIAMVNEQLGL